MNGLTMPTVRDYLMHAMALARKIGMMTKTERDREREWEKYIKWKNIKLLLFADYIGFY